MDVSTLWRKLMAASGSGGIPTPAAQSRVVERASEYARLAKVKGAGGWGGFAGAGAGAAAGGGSGVGRTGSSGSYIAMGDATCINACCIELAAKKLGESIDRARLVRISCAADDRVYANTLQTLQHVLGITFGATNGAPGSGAAAAAAGAGAGDSFVVSNIRELCAAQGCPAVAPFAVSVFHVFRTRYAESVPEFRRAALRFTKPVFAAVAVLLAAKCKAVKVDRKAVLTAAGRGAITEAEYAQVCGSFHTFVGELIAPANAASAKAKAKPKPKPKAAGAAAAGAGAGDEQELMVGSSAGAGAPPSEGELDLRSGADADADDIASDAFEGTADDADLDLASIDANPDLRGTVSAERAKQHALWRAKVLAQIPAPKAVVAAAAANAAAVTVAAPPTNAAAGATGMACAAGSKRKHSETAANVAAAVLATADAARDAAPSAASVEQPAMKKRFAQAKLALMPAPKPASPAAATAGDAHASASGANSNGDAPNVDADADADAEAKPDEPPAPAPATAAAAEPKRPVRPPAAAAAATAADSDDESDRQSMAQLLARMKAASKPAAPPSNAAS